MLHPREAHLTEARAFQKSPAFALYRKLRQVAEHRLARPMQLGMRQARYVGRTKTLFQLLLATTVANLTLVATKLGMMGGSRCFVRRVTSYFVASLALPITLGTPMASRIAPPRPWAVIHA